ncbi:MAG: 23S rRNA (guanosine(2251)-2'-O)-methyltransferase RlmB [Rhodospirillaceae bacterium]|nr:23S rRNA (guanosine(2251)-2'-O)-methyltransferase RlmB [Rhodospirillaceae bacterium]
MQKPAARGQRPIASQRQEAPARQPSTAPRRNPVSVRPLDLPRPEDHPAARHPDRRPERHTDRPGGANQLWLYGQHAVAAALANSKRRILALTATHESAAGLERMRRDAARELPPIETLSREAIEARLPAGAPHQGLAVRCAPLPEIALADLLAELDPAAPAVLVGLDQVTDPQNAGAVLRSAAAFGAHGVILTERHAAPETGTLARAASGALDVVPLVRVGNLARAIDELKAAGFWIFGLAGDADSTLGETELPARIVLMLGAEGSGLRRLTRERCDGLIRLPTRPPIDQLNVSNAAAIALYEANRRRF